MDAVSNLTYHTDDHLLSWISPFTLSGVPILYYTVSITDIFLFFTMNYHTTGPVVINANYTSCHEYTITVVPVNAVGKGDPSSLNYTHIGG